MVVLHKGAELGLWEVRLPSTDSSFRIFMFLIDIPFVADACKGELQFKGLELCQHLLYRYSFLAFHIMAKWILLAFADWIGTGSRESVLE
jgi:hypothetical protein